MFSIGAGLWGNFRQLWLQNNGMNVSEISNILSISMLISACLILVVSIKLSISKLKRFIIISLLLKLLAMGLLLFFNHYNLNIIKILIIFEMIFEKFIIISIYPLILNIKKNDRLYSKRKLVEYLFRDIGILFGGIFIGKAIFNLVINYNTCLFIAFLFILLSIIPLLKLDLKIDEKNSKISFKYIFHDKIVFLYLFNYFIGTIAINTGLGLKMLMLTNKLNFSDNLATNYLLLIGLIADVIGILILKFSKIKNDYISLTIKFGIRMILYILAFIINNPILILIAMTWSILISTAFENITDAPYINRVKNEFQLFFTYIRYMIGILAESIGLFLAGTMYKYGLNYMLGLSSIFIILQLLVAYYLVFLRLHENNN